MEPRHQHKFVEWMVILSTSNLNHFKAMFKISLSPHRH